MSFFKINNSRRTFFELGLLIRPDYRLNVEARRKSLLSGKGSLLLAAISGVSRRNAWKNSWFGAFGSC